MKTIVAALINARTTLQTMNNGKTRNHDAQIAQLSEVIQEIGTPTDPMTMILLQTKMIERVAVALEKIVDIHDNVAAAPQGSPYRSLNVYHTNSANG